MGKFLFAFFTSGGEGREKPYFARAPFTPETLGQKIVDGQENSGPSIITILHLANQWLL